MIYCEGTSRVPLPPSPISSPCPVRSVHLKVRGKEDGSGRAVFPRWRAGLLDDVTRVGECVHLEAWERERGS